MVSMATPPRASALNLLHVAAHRLSSWAQTWPCRCCRRKRSLLLPPAAAGGPKAWSQAAQAVPPSRPRPFLFAAPKRATAPPLAGHHPSTLLSCPQIKPHPGTKPSPAAPAAPAPPPPLRRPRPAPSCTHQLGALPRSAPPSPAASSPPQQQQAALVTAFIAWYSQLVVQDMAVQHGRRVDLGDLGGLLRAAPAPATRAAWPPPPPRRPAPATPSRCGRAAPPPCITAQYGSCAPP
jgi:hypothetical protein